MVKVSISLLAFLFFGTILFAGCTQTQPPVAPATENDLEIYDAVDNSVNDFLSEENQVVPPAQNEPDLGIYDAVDNSVNDYLSQNNLEIYGAVDESVEQFLNNN